MVVCSCKGIYSEDIKDLMDEGLTLNEIVSKLGIGSECSVCLIDLDLLFEESQNK